MAPHMSLFSNSKELAVQAFQDVFNSKERVAIRTVVRQVLAEPQYSPKWGKKNAQPTPMPGTKDPPPLPDNLQSLTVSVPTVVVSGPCTFYGYSESGNPTHYGELIRIRDANVLADYPSAFSGQIRDIVAVNYGTQPNMYSTLFYQNWRTGRNTTFPPPYGQMVTPCGYGLAVLKVPAGISIQVWYTIP
jgi:hypothetical protein